MSKLREWFTLPGLIAIGLLAGGTAIFLWFLFVVSQARAEGPQVRAITAAPSLPQQCAKYYNDGTDQWKDCMGVGKK